MKIYCPKCHYEPTSQDKWNCSCHYIWNTFETMGRCPLCSKIWRDTACPSCHRWSKHHEWYHYDPPPPSDTVVKKTRPEVEMA